MNKTDNLKVIGLRISYLILLIISLTFLFGGISDVKEQWHILNLMKEMEDAKEIPSDILDFEWGEALDEGIGAIGAASEYLSLEEKYDRKKLILGVVKIIIAGMFVIGCIKYLFSKKEELLREFNSQDKSSDIEEHVSYNINLKDNNVIKTENACPNCGKEIRTTDNFCIRCGTRLR